MSNRDLETRVTDQLKALDNGQLFDLGHPLLNRIAESFVKAAGVLFFLYIYIYNKISVLCMHVFTLFFIKFKGKKYLIELSHI